MKTTKRVILAVLPWVTTAVVSGLIGVAAWALGADKTALFIAVCAAAGSVEYAKNLHAAGRL